MFVKEGFIDRNTGKKGDPRMQFTSIQMLQEVLEKHSKKITIQLQIDNLIEAQIETLKNLFKLHKGNHHLDFYFYEPDEKIQLQMSSRKHKVKISQELLDELKKENFMYKLN